MSGVARWHVIIEENLGFERYVQWSLGPLQPVPDQASARQLAEHLAHTYIPSKPALRNGRWAIRKSPDEWIVMVRGATAGYHFRVSVVEFVPPPPGLEG